MGIESEQLVFDYLSRVGDLAHGTSMSAAERAALVNRLRDEIGRQRSTASGGGESRAAVKRILGRMGTPEDVVAAASETPPSAAAPPAPVPPPRLPMSLPLPLPGQGPTLEKPLPDTYWPDGDIGRFRGGIEIPEILRPGLDGEAEAEAEAAVEAGEEEPEPRPGKRAGKHTAKRPAKPADEPPQPPPAQPSPSRRLARAALGGKRVGGIVELLGAALLVAGTVAGSIVVLALGWLTCYWSPRLSRREAQWATFGMPATVAGAYTLWLLGRAGGYWGELLAQGEAEALLADHWPWLLRAAALASAAFLLYRARRHAPPPTTD